MAVHHGEYFMDVIRQKQVNLKQYGKPVLTDGMGTVELLYQAMFFEYYSSIKLDEIETEVREYYKSHKMSYEELMEEEKDEYFKIEQTILKKLPYFVKDINSRRVLWTDDCCISMLHFLVRDNTIHCFLHFRSSDAKRKLPADMFLIHKIARQVQAYVGKKHIQIKVLADSFHEIVIPAKSSLGG